MALISCPECGREVSTAAEACPQCGYPIHSETPELASPTCYTCSATATTRCQRCGALSCVRHLQSTFVLAGGGGRYELRCKSCRAEARMWMIFSFTLTAIIVIGIFAFLIATKAGPFGP